MDDLIDGTINGWPVSLLIERDLGGKGRTGTGRTGTAETAEQNKTETTNSTDLQFCGIRVHVQSNGENHGRPYGETYA